MVRTTRFGWHDTGPIGRELETSHRQLDLDDEPDLKPRARTARKRTRVRKSKPVDLPNPNHTPADSSFSPNS